MLPADPTSLIATIALAFAGYLLTYFNNVRLAQRAERLQRINRQLGELYGPMFALTQASERAWRAFRAKHRRGVPYFDPVVPPGEDDLREWRLWMTAVFMPNNQRLYELVLAHADLLVETHMPEVLLEFIAHAAAYRTVLQRWETGDFSEHTSVIDYPSEQLIAYAHQTFETLKAEQARLMGHR